MLEGNTKSVGLCSGYQPPFYVIDHTYLCFEIYENITTVRSRLQMRRNLWTGVSSAQPLMLHGKDLVLRAVIIDGSTLDAEAYEVNEDYLIIHDPRENFVLECVTEIHPKVNSQLIGLFVSGGIVCTDLEPEGFRRITYYLDRPDVLSTFTVDIVANQEEYPVLLSNGNSLLHESLPDGRHRAVWHDPNRKPAYLFSLVAGDLEYIEDLFITSRGHRVSLRIYVQRNDLDKCHYAMNSLKRAMRWDEVNYGREYDLDILMLVAIYDFNGGAMENKGLNIFDARYILASPGTATDSDYQQVERIVAHEYFHNWSGNRVTCRDWSQLSLKEGFTVFRDASFSADQGFCSLKRIRDAKHLRSIQFTEDAGPLAHPVRPGIDVEASNLYTTTIYDKGAEIVRMIYTLIGSEAFRFGSDLFFRRHDGQSATISDFIKSMSDAGERDFTQFERWYNKAGTPRLTVSGHYFPKDRIYRMTVSQFCLASRSDEPLLIPLKVGLLGESGDLSLRLRNNKDCTSSEASRSITLEITDTTQEFIFEDVMEKPVLSLLRDFSAPVIVEYEYSRVELVFLINNDSNEFCRWDAAQQLALQVLLDLVNDGRKERWTQLDPIYRECFSNLLDNPLKNNAILSEMLELPSEFYLGSFMDEIDVEAIHDARRFVLKSLASSLHKELLDLYQANNVFDKYIPSPEQMDKRSLKNLALSILVYNPDPEIVRLCYEQFNSADNLTDKKSALSALLGCESDEAKQIKLRALESFYQCVKHERLGINHWFSVQAGCAVTGSLENIETLMEHRLLDYNNPGLVQSFIDAFCMHNPTNFHRPDGMGYRLLVNKIIELDQYNSQMAIKILMHFSNWRKYLKPLRELMLCNLLRLRDSKLISKELRDMCARILD